MMNMMTSIPSGEPDANGYTHMFSKTNFEKLAGKEDLEKAISDGSLMDPELRATIFERVTTAFNVQTCDDCPAKDGCEYRAQYDAGAEWVDCGNHIVRWLMEEPEEETAE